MVGDWRDDSTVEMMRCRRGEVRSGGPRLLAILDGEPMRLHKRARIRFVPEAFRALAPAPVQPTA